MMKIFPLQIYMSFKLNTICLWMAGTCTKKKQKRKESNQTNNKEETVTEANTQRAVNAHLYIPLTNTGP